MSNNLKNAIENAFSKNLEDMQNEISSALYQKVSDALDYKRMDLAQSLMQDTNESYIGEESLTKGKRLISTHGEGVYTAKVYYDPDWEEHQVHYYENGKHMGEGPVSYHSGNGRKEDKQEAQDSAESGLKFMNKTKNESYVEEKLSVSDGASAWIDDFVNSDNPRFEGKSKEKRISMALKAFYDAKRKNK